MAIEKGQRRSVGMYLLVGVMFYLAGHLTIHLLRGWL